MQQKSGRKPLAPAAVILASLSLVSVANATTLEAGAGKTYPTPCAAIAAAQPNDVIEVAAGTYTDSCSIGVAGLTVKGVGGRPKIDLSATDHPAEYKGIYVVNADDVRLENLELTGAHISTDYGLNGAGVRVLGSGLVIHGCYIHDNQDGVLGTPAGTTSTITIENTELAHNALGDGCNHGGCTHNVYLGAFAKALFQYNWTHDIADDTNDKGHLFKSRAKQNMVLYNRVTGEDGHDSYALNFPSSGLAIVVGNVVQKGTHADNTVLLAYGEEGAPYADNRLFVANNTLVNDADQGTFIKMVGGALTAHDNLFVGSGTISSTGMLSADNLIAVDPLFASRAQYDYHLLAGSPAIDQGVDPGSADAFSLTPTAEYVQPASASRRKSDGKLDVGAFEYGSDPTIGVDSDAGSATVDTGTATGTATRTTSDGGTTGASNETASSNDSSGCNAGGGGAGNLLGTGVGGLAVVALGTVLRRKRKPSRP